MRHVENPIKNEQGSLLFVAMILLTLLTLIGISSINTSTTELRIATNAQNYQMDFFLADSAWKEGAVWLDSFQAPPSFIGNSATADLDENNVKNYGVDPVDTTQPNLNVDLLYNDFPNNTWDGTSEAYGIPYWYKIQLDGSEIDTTAGNTSKTLRFFYAITANANRTQQVQVTVSKPWKAGYK